MTSALGRISIYFSHTWLREKWIGTYIHPVNSSSFWDDVSVANSLLQVTQQLSSSEPCLTTNPCLANSLPPNPSPVHSLPPNPCLANSLHPNPSPAHSLPPNPSPVHSLPPNPCLANSLHPNPSPAHSLPPNPCLAHSLPPNPCPNATEPIPTAINKKVSWLGGDSATKDPKPGPSASPKVKRKRGRPAKSAVRKDRGKKIPLIHDFIRGLLEDPTMKDVVFWEDKTEGMFRINDSNGIANEWGKLKNKKGMTYEKFSRALRYHHRSKSSALIPVPGRLLFKFTSITKSRTSG
ncbi:hypothetical protein Pmani_022901 [Petrolisthes manimaculis]|uniref:ETS domain-containing protein n=1 Tax=Petrolisthes manimaculis TaxID=1843537 RepID=A0AAE1U402_9EUCA|nr:hypothetical protein Pmani_022901 [Petrolisthes manimaculis]